MRGQEFDIVSEVSLVIGGGYAVMERNQYPVADNIRQWASIDLYQMSAATVAGVETMSAIKRLTISYRGFRNQSGLAVQIRQQNSMNWMICNQSRREPENRQDEWHSHRREYAYASIP